MSGDVISVVVCVHNGATFLRDALDSIAAQQHAALDVIVIDDGSHDGSAAIATSHPLRPTVVTQEQQGHTAALNHGIRLATGQFLAFVDHDDCWPAGRLHDMLDALSRDPAADAVYGKVVNTNSALNPVAEPIAVQLAGAMLIRRDSALRVGEFRTDVTHAFILDWISRARASGLRFIPVDRTVLLRRVHGENIGMRAGSAAQRDLLRVMRDHLRRQRS